MVTIKGVAREAGVSVGTASEALAGRPRVRESTRERVLAVAKRLRYQPSAVARGLVTHRTQTIGLLISDIANSFFVHAVRVIEDLAHENGYNVILCNTDEDPAKEAEFLRVLMERRVDGISLARTAAKEAIQEVGWGHIPLVLFDRRLPGMAISSVTVDGVTGGRLVTQYLLELRHRRIGVIHGPLVRSHGVGRLQGYQEALQEAGVQPDPALIRAGTFKQASGYALAQQLLTLTPPPSALFCTNNLLRNSCAPPGD